MRVENRETESQEKEESREPARDFRQHICRLRAENVFRHAAAKGCAQALAFWTLHQDHEDHEKRDENVEPEQDIDQKGHRDGQYRQPARFVNRGVGVTPPLSVSPHSKSGPVLQVRPRPTSSRVRAIRLRPC